MREWTAAMLLLALAGCAPGTQSGGTAAPDQPPQVRATGNAAAPAVLAEADRVAQPQGVSRPIDEGIDAVPPVAPAPPGTAPAGSCAAEIGAQMATELARQCRMVSPATRPPCNPLNSCAMIRDEIARGCAMLEGDGRPASCDQQPAPR